MLNALTKLFRRRPRLDYSSGPVVDLDQVIQQPLRIRWDSRGKVFVINPITTENFLKISNGMLGIQELAKPPAVKDTKQMIDAYYDLFASICDNITYEDVKEMQLAQCAAFYIAIVEKVSGRSHELKKKVLMAQTA